jgi:hypothetical protein
MNLAPTPNGELAVDNTLHGLWTERTALTHNSRTAGCLSFAISEDSHPNFEKSFVKPGRSGDNDKGHDVPWPNETTTVFQ